MSNSMLVSSGAAAVCSKMQFDRIQCVIDTVTTHAKASASSNLLWWVIPGVLAGMPMPFIHPERRMTDSVSGAICDQFAGCLLMQELP